MVAMCNITSDADLDKSIDDQSKDELGFLARTIDNMIAEMKQLGIQYAADQRQKLIIDYLRVNNIPLIHKTYVLARTKYLNGEITTEMVQKQKEQLELNKIPTKVLIPSKK